MSKRKNIMEIERRWLDMLIKPKRHEVSAKLTTEFCVALGLSEVCVRKRGKHILVSLSKGDTEYTMLLKDLYYKESIEDWFPTPRVTGILRRLGGDGKCYSREIVIIDIKSDLHGCRWTHFCAIDSPGREICVSLKEVHQWLKTIL